MSAVAGRLAPVGRTHRRNVQVAVTRLRSTAAVDSTSTVTSSLDDTKPFSEVPGPKPVPGLGNIWRFIPGIGDFADVPPLKIPGELHRRFGPLVKLEGMMAKTKLFVAEPTAVEQIFRTEGKWPIRDGITCFEYYYKNHRKIVDYSLGTQNGEKWQKFRSIVNQVVMQPRNVKIYVEPIDNVAIQFVERLKSLRDSNQQLPDDLVTEIQKWACESITYVALDTRLGMLDEDFGPDSEAGRILGHVQKAFGSMSKLEFGMSPWKYVSTPTWRTFRDSMNAFTEFATRQVDVVVDRLSKLTPEELSSRQLSVLERLLVNNSQDPAKGVAFALDMLLAGIDTTAHQFSFVLYYIASNPDKQRLVQEELDREWPKGETLTSAHLERFKYMRACIKEAGRLQSSVSGVLRTTFKDLNLLGYHIPKGTQCIISSSVMCHDERLVPRAEEFLPERWMVGHEHLKPKPFVYLPFGFGPRMCAGMRFADLEIEVLLARFLKTCDLSWEYPAPTKEQKTFVQITSPFKVTMKTRQQVAPPS